MPTNIMSSSNKIYAEYADFLRACLPLLDSPIPASDVPNWNKAGGDLDYYSPFREKAPSRAAVLHYPDSPFSPTRVLTRAGMFSILVFRGILFNTKALRDGAPLMFHTLAEWMTYRRKKKESYCCNTRAYGVTNSRSTANAAAYWAGSDAIVERIREGTGFLELVKFIADKKVRKKSAYPGFGKLSSYLLVVDLVYAKVVTEPTIEEIADTVVWLDKGAAAQLRQLGVPRDRVREEFIEMYRFLMSEGLTQDERERMGFNVFVQEHGLCKRGRFYKH